MNKRSLSSPFLDPKYIPPSSIVLQLPTPQPAAHHSLRHRPRIPTKLRGKALTVSRTYSRRINLQDVARNRGYDEGRRAVEFDPRIRQVFDIALVSVNELSRSPAHTDCPRSLYDSWRRLAWNFVGERGSEWPGHSRSPAPHAGPGGSQGNACRCPRGID